MNKIQTLSIILAMTIMSALGAFPQSSGKNQSPDKQSTFTGIVSDSMCGKNHMMKDKSAAECTRVCVKQGMDYALVVGQEIYTLKGNTSEIDKYAGEPATIKGKMNGKTIEVESISAAKKS